MNEIHETDCAIAVQNRAGVGRRSVLKMTGTGITALSVGAIATGSAVAQSRVTPSDKWDKTFAQSDKVDHQKLTFKNRYGIPLVGDLYQPKNASGRLPAIVVCGPFGAVKEQASGLYAQTMAERGFVTLAFDPSYTGESGGEPPPELQGKELLVVTTTAGVKDAYSPKGRLGFTIEEVLTPLRASANYTGMRFSKPLTFFAASGSPNALRGYQDALAARLGEPPTLK